MLIWKSLKKWLDSRKSAKILIESLDEKDLNKGVLKHPLVGRIIWI